MALCNNTLNAKNGVLMNKNTTVEKQCATCKQILPISKFRRYKHQFGDSGYRGSCRECERAQDQERRQKKTQLGVEKNDTFRFTDCYKKIKGG